MIAFKLENKWRSTIQMSVTNVITKYTPRNNKLVILICACRQLDMAREVEDFRLVLNFLKIITYIDNFLKVRYPSVSHYFLRRKKEQNMDTRGNLFLKMSTTNLIWFIFLIYGKAFVPVPVFCICACLDRFSLVVITKLACFDILKSVRRFLWNQVCE